MEATTIDWELTWATVGAIAACVLAFGVFWAIRQVRETRKSTNAQLAVELFRELRGEETKATLRLIYRLAPDDVSRLSDENASIGITNLKNEIDGVLDKFELLGALVKQNIIDETLAIEAFAGPPALRCWYQLVEYIKDGRKKRGVVADNYEGYARHTLDYCKKKHIQVKLNDKELVQALKEDSSRCPRSWKEIEQERGEEK